MSELDKQIRDLSKEEPVDICYGRDGMADDTIVVDAGLLQDEGFGNLHLEETGCGYTAWVSKKLFYVIDERCG